MKKVIKKIIWWFLGIVLAFILFIITTLVILEKSSSKISIGQPIKSIGYLNSALLVIDIQEATTGEVSNDPFYIENSDSLIKRLNRTIEIFNDNNLPVIFIRSEITNPIINLINNSYAKGSIGAQFDKRLNVKNGITVIKSKNDSFLDTYLDSILVHKKINDLYITGLDAAYCINSTIKAAQNRGYRINIIQDEILSKSNAMKDSMIHVFKDNSVNIISFKDLNIN